MNRIGAVRHFRDWLAARPPYRNWFFSRNAAECPLARFAGALVFDSAYCDPDRPKHLRKLPKWAVDFVQTIDRVEPSPLVPVSPYQALACLDIVIERQLHGL